MLTVQEAETLILNATTDHAVIGVLIDGNTYQAARNLVRRGILTQLPAESNTSMRRFRRVQEHIPQQTAPPVEE